jgi:hypothetical protein
MKKFLLGGFFPVFMGIAQAGFCQYAPYAKDAYPLQHSGLPTFPTPVTRTVTNTRVVRKVKPGPPKKVGFIPLYPNGKPAPVRHQKIKTPPLSGPASIVSPRNQKIRNLTNPVSTPVNVPFHSLYQDP